MAELRDLTMDLFEILVVRELRKTGLTVSDVRRHRGRRLPEPEQGELLELSARLAFPGWTRHALVACRRQEAPIGRGAVESVEMHVNEADLEGGILFAAADIEPDAWEAARTMRVVVLRVVDGRTAFDTSGWGTAGHYPAWLPDYTAQALMREPGGDLGYRLLETGQAQMIIDGLGDRPTDQEGARQHDV